MEETALTELATRPPNCINTNTKTRSSAGRFWATALLAVTAAASVALAQPSARPGPTVVSPEISSERKLTFRILAPKAEAVQLGGSGDIPGTGFGQATLLRKRKARTLGSTGVNT